jgi:hypothetical protein
MPATWLFIKHNLKILSNFYDSWTQTTFYLKFRTTLKIKRKRRKMSGIFEIFEMGPKWIQTTMAKKRQGSWPPRIWAFQNIIPTFCEGDGREKVVHGSLLMQEINKWSHFAVKCPIDQPLYRGKVSMKICMQTAAKTNPLMGPLFEILLVYKTNRTCLVWAFVTSVCIRIPQFCVVAESTF